ncbi:MAG: response regulator [Opitutales bacterium]
MNEIQAQPGSDSDLEPSSQKSLEGKTIFQLDDDPHQGILIGRYLKDAGCHFRAVQTAEALWGLLERETCDLLILDVMMPGLDGWALFDQIRSGNEYADLPVLFVTCVVDRDQEAQTCDSSQRCVTLAKPVDKDRLQRAAAQLLEA